MLDSMNLVQQTVTIPFGLHFAQSKSFQGFIKKKKKKKERISFDIEGKIDATKLVTSSWSFL